MVTLEVERMGSLRSQEIVASIQDRAVVTEVFRGVCVYVSVRESDRVRMECNNLRLWKVNVAWSLAPKAAIVSTGPELAAL